MVKYNNVRGGYTLTLIHFAIFLPVIAAIAIAIIYRYVKDVHLGWFVLPIPAVIVAYLFSLIPSIANNQVFHHTLNLMPRIGLNTYFRYWHAGSIIFYRLLIKRRKAWQFLCLLAYLHDRHARSSFK